ncbi:MAG TPA: recombinase family protein [Bacteriovoracaceae bacterium]|nr:recombinase family protein [Bacteriovoracaceae bacterium]
MQLKIGIYVRVSTEEQAQVADGSIESQQYRVKSFVDIKKIHDKNWGKIIDTYIDDGYSAKNTKRPAYQRMMKDVRGGKINLILVADISRLSRNIADFCLLLKELEISKAKFLSIKEQFDTSTPAGEMMIFNMINLAQFERKQTSERISMNFHSRAMRGLSNGGGHVLGYDKDPTNPGKLIINESEANLVKKIFSLYNEGNSLSVTADRLNKESEKRKECSTVYFRHLKDGLWTIRAVQTILNNYAYIGIREVNKQYKNEEQSQLKAWQLYQLVPASWAAIISKSLFERTQKSLKIANKIQRHRFDNSEKRIFLVSGVTKCGHCGRALIGQTAHGKDKTHRYYGHKYLIGETIKCPIKRFSAEEIESSILNHLGSILKDAGYLDKIEENILKSMGTSKQSITAKKVVLEKAVAKIKNEIESVFNVLTSFGNGSAGSNLIQEKLQTLAERKLELEKEREALVLEEMNIEAGNDSRKTISSNLSEFKNGFRKASPTMKKRLITNIFNQLILTDEGINVYYAFADDSNNYSQIQNKKGSLDKSGDPSKSFRQPLGFFPSQNLSIVQLGGGGGNRTRVRRTF